MSPRLATFLVFAVNGAMIGTWVAHIPWLQDHLGISKATLGLCLLCMAAGALVSMPLTGHVLDRRPSASLTRWTTLVFCLMLPLPLLATSPYMLGAILFVFGASNGAMDVSMNAHGVAIQEQLDRPVMSSFHGGWSVGGFAASGLVAVAAAAGLDPRVESLIVGVALLLLSLWITRRLGAASAHSSAGHGLALPDAGRAPDRRPLLPRDAGRGRHRRLERHLPPAQTPARAPPTAALAFTGFSLGMAIARLGGDFVNARIGAGSSAARRNGAGRDRARRRAPDRRRPCLPSSASSSAASGSRTRSPLLFSAAGRVDPPGPSLAAAFTLGYTGFIVGPPVIGVLSDQVGLPRTLALLLLAPVAVTVLGGRGARQDQFPVDAPTPRLPSAK